MFDNQKELLTWIDTVSNVENLDKESVKNALEEALATGIRKDFSKDSLLSVEIDDQGESKLYMNWIVVDDNEENFSNNHHVYEDIAQEKFDENLVIGDNYKEEITDYSFKRVNASIVRQLLKKNIREAHNLRLKKSLNSKKGQLILVNVKKYDKNGYIVEYNNEVTGFLPYENLFNSSEKLRVGNSYFVVLDDLDKSFKNFTIIFTRANDEFVRNIFAREISEISDELIEVKSISRVPNQKVIVSVHTGDKKLDPIGCCVGSRGVRIQSISKHFNGEKVEIVKWHADPVDMILEIANLDIQKMVVEDSKISVVLSNESYDSSNVTNLTIVFSNLIGKDIELERASEFFAQENIENSIHVKYLMDTMNLDLDSATYLVELGLLSIDDINSLSLDDMEELGLSDDDASAIKEVASNSAIERSEFIKSKKTDLSEMDLLNDYMVHMLLKNNISNKDLLAELSTFELIDIVPVDEKYAGEVILEARKVWEL
jgi:N utilization substance protein A